MTLLTLPTGIERDDLKNGHKPCPNCTEFTYIFRAAVIESLPKDYTGELCPKCNLWMCRIDKIGERDKS